MNKARAGAQAGWRKIQKSSFDIIKPNLRTQKERKNETKEVKKESKKKRNQSTRTQHKCQSNKFVSTFLRCSPFLPLYFFCLRCTSGAYLFTLFSLLCEFQFLSRLYIVFYRYACACLKWQLASRTTYTQSEIESEKNNTNDSS